MQEPAPSVSKTRRTASVAGSSSTLGKGKGRTRRERRPATRVPLSSANPAPSLLHSALLFLRMAVAGVWRILSQIHMLAAPLRLLQRVLLHGLAALQYVNDFPTRMQFQRTTRRFLSVMNTTEDYATFVDAAASLDHYCGVAQWAQEAPPMTTCDAVGLLVDAVAAQQLVQTANVAGMEVFLCSLLKRNAHGLMDPSVYNYFTCAKHCIEDYTQAMESLIAAYASAEPADDKVSSSLVAGAPRRGFADVAAVASTTSSQSLRTCWVHTDSLQQRGTTTAPHLSFSPPWESSVAAKATAAFTAVTTTSPSTSSILPAVDITTRIQHAWRRTASEHAFLTGSCHGSLSRCHPQLSQHGSLSRQASGSTGLSTRPHSATTTVAKGSSRLLLGSASAGEESNYLTEDGAPSASAGSAVGPTSVAGETAVQRGGTEGRSSSTAYPPTTTKSTSPHAATRATVMGVLADAVHASTSVPGPEHALLSHIDASCAALHRFLDGGAAASPLLPAPPTLPRMPLQRRLRVLRQVLHSFGRTALVLSGGASMGTYHAGVARALYEADVMPDVLCGSSAGSIIAALVSTKTPAELRSFMQSDVLSTEAMQISPFGEDASLAEKLRRFFKTGFLMDVRTLMECMRGQCGDLTFLEAYTLSGKVLNVSVTRSQHEGTHADRHALLNYVTAPDVVIWSAVSASCALPGLFTAVQLIEKPPSAGGAFAPYLPGELWCDGSVAQDIPRRLLTQLFGVDYLIVSQVNPYVIPFLRHPKPHLVVSSGPSVFSRLWFALVSVWVWLLTVLFSLRLLPRSGACELLFLAFAQDYGGDVTIYPVESLLTAAPDYLNLVNNPSAEYISYVASRAQCRTWPLVTRVRLATTIERCLLRELRRLERAELAEEDEA